MTDKHPVELLELKNNILEKWHLEEHLHLPRTGSDATTGFDAGWDAACEIKNKEIEELNGKLSVAREALNSAIEYGRLNWDDAGRYLALIE